ncbi:MAG: ABC transporter permease [Limisphaerales bacterium]
MRPQTSNLWRAELRESFRMALEAIRAHKLRSALTLLGVVVGVFSIIGVMTAIRVLQVNIEKEFAGIGANTFAVQKLPGVYFGGDEGFEKFWRRKNITLQDARTLRDRATLARYMGFEDTFWAGEVVSRFAKTPPNVRLIGGTPGSFPAKNFTVDEGRPLSESDVEGSRDVCVLGHGLAQALFPHGSALGERVKFSGINYTVIGVLETKGASLGNQENFAIIPISTGLNRYGRFWRSLSILIQAESQETYEDTVEQVRGIMRTLRKVKPGEPDDFEIFSNDTMIAQFRDFTLKVRAGVALVSSIALLAAGVGIMNIMLVSVTERTKEIGIRRAIGAKKRNIMTQFVMEAVVLCEVGGVIGVIFGIAAGNAAAYFLKVPPEIPLDWTIFGLVICSVVGIVFGTYPAIKAANLDPIESLRYE